MSDKHQFKVNIGDWSQDGHNQYDVLVLNSTKPVDEVQKAFKKAATDLHLLVNGRFLIADEFEDCSLSEDHAEVLKNAGVKFDDLVYNDGDDEEPNYIIEGSSDMTILVMRIAQLELDFEFEITNDAIPNFNGFWTEEQMPSIGYGLYNI
ncbi:hypothetical protein pEaSNUABM50_00466 [Erwinia phage pEa_SNUABM_50]|uniref:Uncharacterized protein n=4 Tax=Eneladusvirus BF TaxID=2560751 RepID=A0A7L8ZN94_9CAUD|nr:hypothetical protein FDH34_gp466 [Serratia phage BF]QOI71392.1 hypothetical protein pEaSNUABM12_00471 [Erwinia phage pEa_SNUABM_12]QOI71934.1 hypothetical protein pEaSNUABM47_00467 [Erwinia phage pEa_SNUABM_47]QOI72474.1 hypothetical protein pEaSNUABM50_00466 [Erwinia phage pEa_SNUABM_50]QXO11601.1 hypothetical protein pEaSNUABM19_00472 [Erwinia phage pEa_SNUABM_19]QXO12149.1 hypothetical protein pEaSNUABM44_00470 [Erwinia phage pEa_SNUABM_44]QXO12703.1 hypothetical protein pEaSNUABM49_004